MKLKCALVMVVVALMSVSVHAEGDKGGEGKEGRRGPGGSGPGGMIEKLQKAAGDLNLSADQKTKLEAAIQSAKDDAKKIMEEGKASGDRKATMEAMREVMQELHEQVGAILTAEQKEKLRSAMGGRPGMMGGAMLERFKHALSQLNLSEEQKEKIKEIFAASHEQIEALKKDGEGEKGEKLKAIFEETREQVLAVLTPEQQAKLKEMREQRGGPGGGRGHRHGGGEEDSGAGKDKGGEK